MATMMCGVGVWMLVVLTFIGWKPVINVSADFLKAVFELLFNFLQVVDGLTVIFGVLQAFLETLASFFSILTLFL